MQITDKIREYLLNKSNELATQFYSFVISEFDENPDRIMESPIEQLFYIEWRYREYADELELPIFPQYQDKSTGKYRIDFIISFIQEIYKWGLSLEIENKILEIPIPKLGIEIDSHIWHEKTKEQVQYHKERERFLIANGWKLLRFTGSEVYKNPSKCVDEVLEIAENLQIEYHKKIKEKIYG